VGFLTPAFGQLILFFATLFFFLLVRPQLFRALILLPSERGARLRTLGILRGIEQDLTRYLGTVSVINIAVGVATGIIVDVIGYPNAALWGVLAFLLNYLPYVGPAIMILVLFTVGLVTFPSLIEAAIAPICFLALTTVEGYLITPNIIGKRHALNPFAVLLALAFWTWLWGPVGTFLAVPLLITGNLAIHHFLVEEKGTLPG
jgi:predicted PurR-regulated permease PerM